MTEDVTVEVFYSKTCPNCPAQKDLADDFRDEEGLEVKMTDVAKKNGRAKNHGVRAVPTTIVDGPTMEQKTGFRGVMGEKKLETAIEVAKGEKDPEELENSLLKKIKGLFWRKLYYESYRERKRRARTCYSRLSTRRRTCR